MTRFTLRGREDLLAVRLAVSPVWETQAAVQALADERGRCYHEPWLRLVQARAARLDLCPLPAVLPRRGYVPDFLVPPPRVPRPGIGAQLTAIRATGPAQVARELAACRDTVHGERHRRLIASLLTDPERARDQLADRLHQAWASLVAPFWVRLRALLDKDIEERSRTLAGHGLRRVLGELHPKIRWTSRGLSLADRSGRTVVVGERGFLLMPSAYLWPHAAAIVEPPWLPTIIYPAAGIAGLWQASPAPDRALERLLGRTPRPGPVRPGPAAVHHRAGRAQPSRRLPPPARPARRWTAGHRPPRAPGPLLPDRARIRAAERPPPIAQATTLASRHVTDIGPNETRTLSRRSERFALSGALR